MVPIETRMYKHETREQLVASWKAAKERLENKSSGPAVMASDTFLTGLTSETLPSKLCNLIAYNLSDVELQRSTARIFIKTQELVLPAFRGFFEKSLQCRHGTWDDSDCEDSVSRDSSFSMEDMSLENKNVFESIRVLGWLSLSITGVKRILMQVLHQEIQVFVSNKCKGNFETPLFLKIMNWKDAVIVPFVKDIVCHDLELYNREEWAYQLNLAVSESFCNLRIQEMFDIITDFPDSQTCVLELRDALTRFHTGMNYFPKKLTNQLHTSFSARLLHPGANTSQILDVYISTIKVLRIVDSTDVLLDEVSKPIQAYLRNRKDTVRCICTGLTDEESGGDLYEELRRQGGKPLDQVGYGSDSDSDYELEGPRPNWQPKSTLVAPSSTEIANSTNISHQNDILSMLVGIYGSKELFVEEYRSLLADKLLSNLSFETDRDVHTLELLKLRFGQESMHHCEIMIKDIDDSRRMNSNLKSSATTVLRERREQQRHMVKSQFHDEDFVVSATIISNVYWPTFEREDFKVHPDSMQEQLNQYSKEFAKLKNPRRLVWLEQMGSVDIDLFICDKKVSFSCAPLHATLISHFEDKELWTCEELANETGLMEEDIMKEMNFWVNNHVVRVDYGDTSKAVYELDVSTDHLVDPRDDNDLTSEMTFFSRKEQKDLSVYESYILNMLNMRGELNLLQIQQALALSTNESEVKLSTKEIVDVLQKLSLDGTVERGSNGCYRSV